MKIAENKQYFNTVLFACSKLTHKIKGILREPLSGVGKGRE